MARPHGATQGAGHFSSLPVILDQARTEHASEAPISAPSDLEAPDRAGSTLDRYTDARLSGSIRSPLFLDGPLLSGFSKRLSNRHAESLSKLHLARIEMLNAAAWNKNPGRLSGVPA